MEPAQLTERRSGKFTETISLFMVRVAAVGAAIVLIDIKLTITMFDQTVQVGSGFSADLKGAVITAILISGFTAVKEYWLGSSAGDDKKADSVSRIAEASAPGTSSITSTNGHSKGST